MPSSKFTETITPTGDGVKFNFRRVAVSFEEFVLFAIGIFSPCTCNVFHKCMRETICEQEHADNRIYEAKNALRRMT